MAGTACGERLEVEEVQGEAVRRGFTFRGEMFSVDNMAELSRLSLAREARVESSSVLGEPAWVVDTLTSGHLLLVPYDCGHNHGPALHKGKKAHWALITGFVVATKHMETETIQHLLLEPNVGNNFVIDPTSDAAHSAVKDFVQQKSAKIYLLAR